MSFSQGDDYSFLHLTPDWVDPMELTADELRAIVEANELDRAARDNR